MGLKLSFKTYQEDRKTSGETITINLLSLVEEVVEMTAVPTKMNRTKEFVFKNKLHMQCENYAF